MEKEVQGCSSCPYRKGNIVPPVGNEQAELVIVGESPGAEEVKRGIPFCGASGELLALYLRDNLFPEELGQIKSFEEFLVAREKVCYITNACLCELKKPTKEAAEYCKERLRRELRKLRPKLVLALGAQALEFVVGEEKITEYRGFVLDTDFGRVLPTFHPAYVLRVPEMEEVFAKDLAKARSVLQGRFEYEGYDTIVLESTPAIEWLLSEVSKLTEKHLLAIDLETTGFSFIRDSIICASLSFDGKVGYVIPNGTPLFSEVMREILSCPARKTGANLKFDLKFLKRLGVEIKNMYFDVTCAQHVLNENLPLDLTSLTSLYTNLPKYDAELSKYRKEVKSYAEIPRDVLYEYASGDAVATFRVTEVLEKMIKSDPGHSRLFWEVVLPAAKAFVEVEYHGMKVDRERISALTHQLQGEIRELETELYEVVGEEFNWRSTKQLQRVLFEKLGLPVLRSTAKGAASTNEETLRELAPYHEAVRILLKLRKRNKILTTYLAGGKGGIYRFVEEDGRVHPDFNINGTVTGRTSCTDPPLQTIPKTAVRSIFVAPPGYKLIEADLSQAELRVMAYLSQCQKMITAFKEGADFHRMTASSVFKKPFEKVTDKERKMAKFIVFGLIYGRGAKSIAEQFDISEEEARDLLDRFFRSYPEIRRAMDYFVETAKSKRVLRNLFGRTRRFGQNCPFFPAWERQALNFPIQSVVADHVNQSMAILVQLFKKANLDAHVVLNVHDALFVECKEEIVDTVAKVVKVVMERPVAGKFVIPVDITIGDQWGSKEGKIVDED